MPPMKWIASLALVVACGGGDDTSDGARAQCAFGGELTDCPDAAKTSEGACWRLVDCGAIPVDSEDPNDPNEFDWGVCVDFLDGLTADRRRLVVACIAASTCDELRVANFCGKLGDN
jgi:hypothetical protein